MTTTPGSNFKKWAAAAVLTTGLGLGGMALAGPASAQDETSTTAPTEQTQPDASAPDTSGDQAERPGRRGKGLETAAEALGLSVEDLRSELGEDTSLADVAEAQDVDVQTVIDAMVAEARTHLDERVSDGGLTQERADERLANLTERITERANTAGRPEGGRGPSGRGGCDKGDEAPADGGSAPADAPADDTPADGFSQDGLGSVIG